ncbi:hypothetical protein FKR81_16685 [Lentzea tibetensis]|uniref:Uncharacterized protein n=1 Tax=Lentzea tibetensis TaxID=2591470 RepID=A0A563EU91_9PSEU|nr:hypothetical protein [Lentzea tibetensis]TWP51249.1 hypothetical protein FKR81_16685 [Lentzea tibetensis]
MLTTITCVVVTCDECGDNNERDYIPHYTGESDAIEQLCVQGWRVLGDGTLACPVCVAKQTCQLNGHQWAPWRPCHCHGQVLRHVGTPNGLCGNEFRWCERCDHGEERSCGATATTAVA